METKVCTQCKKEKPLTTEFFHMDRSKVSGFSSSVCKECKKEKYKKASKFNDLSRETALKQDKALSDIVRKSVFACRNNIDSLGISYSKVAVRLGVPEEDVFEWFLGRKEPSLESFIKLQQVSDLRTSLENLTPMKVNEKESLEQKEKRAVEEALIASRGIVSEAAKILGVSRSSIYNKFKRLGIERAKIFNERSKTPFKAKKEEPKSSIYFIELLGSEVIKIGFSRDPESRLRQMQTSNPHELRMLKVISGGYEKEAEIHEKFSKNRVRGEWFKASKKLRKYIEDA